MRMHNIRRFVSGLVEGSWITRVGELTLHVDERQLPDYISRSGAGARNRNLARSAGSRWWCGKVAIRG